MADSIYAFEPIAAVPEQLVSAPRPPLDLSHHFSRVTKARKESTMKEFYKYFMIPGIGNLAGGQYCLHAQPLLSIFQSFWTLAHDFEGGIDVMYRSSGRDKLQSAFIFE